MRIRPVAAADREPLRAVIASDATFKDEEQAVALELVDAAIEGAPDYEILVADDGEVQGYVRGTAVVGAVRFATGETADSTVAFVGTPSRDRYEGVLLAGTPRYEGVGAASGASTTCMSNGFTLRPA